MPDGCPVNSPVENAPCTVVVHETKNGYTIHGDGNATWINWYELQDRKRNEIE